MNVYRESWSASELPRDGEAIRIQWNQVERSQMSEPCRSEAVPFTCGLNGEAEIHQQARDQA